MKTKYAYLLYCKYAFIIGLCASVAVLPTTSYAQQYRVIHFSTGTGFFVSRDGHVLTNAHVVGSCRKAEVIGNTVSGMADVIETDEKNDMALLRIRGVPSAAAVFRSSSKPMREGDPVMVIGHPLGKKLTTREATFIADSGPLNDPQWLRFSSSVFQGNSGGPLLDGSGQAIGMIMAKATTYRYNTGRAKNEVVANADVAIKPYKIAELLGRHGVSMQYGEKTSELAAHRVEDIARDFVVQVKCQLD